MLTCGARKPVACIAPATQHVQLYVEDGESAELVLCDAHFDELEPEYRRDWHAVGSRCSYPWRMWDHDGRRCVEDESDNSERTFTIDELVKLLDEDPAP